MRLILLTGLLMLGACAQNGLQSNQANSARLDRSVWQDLTMADQAAHARALQMALETREATPVAWSSGGASGEVVVLSTSDLTKRPVCRTFSDRITIGDQVVEGRDAACWANAGWIYMTPGPARAVIAPAYVAADRTFVVKRRSTTLSRIARSTKTDLADLRKLNPQLPAKIPRGTQVLLP